MTTPPDTPPAGSRPRVGLWWTVPLLGALLLLLPSALGRAVLLPTDIQYDFAPWSTAADAPATTENPLLRDLIDTYDPEQRTIWENLRAGQEAGWLSGSGMGAPGWWFVGTGAMSPFVVLGQLLPLAGALGIAGVLRLGLAGIGVGLLGRRLGLSSWAAAVSAGAFAFSGFMISWLGWPQTHVGAAVGWVWWATIRAADDDAPWWSVAALATATAAAWVGGFPAIAALLVLTAAGLGLAQSLGGPGTPTAQRGGLAGLVRVASGLGGGTLLSGVLLLPSLAFLQAVDLSARAEAWRGALPLPLLARWIVPDLYGDGEAVAYWGRINLIEGAAYIGIPALLLAGLAVWYRTDQPAVRRVGALALVTGLGVYGFPPLLQVLRLLPGLDTNPPARGVVLTCAAVSVLAGFGLDALRDPARRTSRAGQLALVGVAGAVVVAAVISRPDLQVRELAAQRLTPGPVLDAARSLAFSATARAAAIAAVAALLAVLVARGGARVAAAATTALVLVAVIDPLVAGAGWNAQRPPSELYPRVESLAGLAAAVPPPGRIAAASGVLLPMTDLRYDYDDARGRRFVTTELRHLIEAAGGEFSSPTRWDLAADASLWTDGLGRLGIRGVVLRPHEPAPPAPAWGPAPQPLGPVADGAELTATVASPRQPVAAVTLRIGTYGRSNDGRLLVELGAGGRSSEGSIPVGGLADGQMVEVPLTPPLDARAATELRLRISSEGAGATGVAVFGDDTGSPVVGLRTGPRWPVRDLGGLQVAEVPGWTDWASAVTDVRTVATDRPDGAAQQVISVGADVVHVAGADVVHVAAADLGVAGLEASASPRRGARIQSVSVDGRTIEAVLDAPDGAVLRLLEPSLPGWRATVDGQAAPVVVADTAFVGVVVPPGGQRVVVEWGAPGLRAGTVLTVVTALALLVWSGVSRRRARPRR